MAEAALKEDAYGFDADERAAFDAMRSGASEAPSGDTGTGGDAPAAPEAPAAPAVPAAPGAAPAAGAAPAGEAVEDDDDDAPVVVTDPKTGKQQRRVNFKKYERLEQRFNATAAERDQFRTELTQMRDQSTRLDERLRLINEALATPTQQEQNQEDQDPAPDPEADIFGYVKWQNRQMERLYGRLNDQVSQLGQSYTSQQAETSLVTNYRADANRFATAQPAFGRAYVHLINGRLRQLEAGGVADANERNRIVVDEERDLVSAALQARQSPAERIYNLALAYGFDPNAVSPPNPTAASAAPAVAPPAAGAAPPNGVARPNGAAAPAAAATPAVPSVAAEIAAIQNGQGAALSLSNAGGAPADQLTPEVLANMPQEEFSALMDRLPKHKMRALMGG